MNAAQRRESILEKLSAAKAPVSASALAGQLGVSRQIVVGDVALLRAGGAQIDATPRGYQLHPAEKGFTGILACVHSTEDEMRTELYTVVDQGGVVVDVTVENSLYGELCGNLNIASRYDVDNFIRQAKDTPECLLSRMTGGVHLHTLHCPDAGTFQRIKKALDEKGILYRKE
jgi:transcriptional regulator of NAD metabolism